MTVAKEIELEDKFENPGAQIAREVASKRSSAAGGGATTATATAQAIVKEGVTAVSRGRQSDGRLSHHRLTTEAMVAEKRRPPRPPCRAAAWTPEPATETEGTARPPFHRRRPDLRPRRQGGRPERSAAAIRPPISRTTFLPDCLSIAN